jgi:lipopolysaccharide biosynthesis regulator YciM
MPGEAEATYRRLWERGDRRGGEGLRDVLADAGRLADAASVQRALGGGGEDPVLAHLLAALARAHLPGDVAAALETARRAVAACPASADALLAVAEAEGAAGDVGAAGDALRSALETDPGAALLAWPALEALGDPGRGLAVLDGLPAAARDGAALRHLRGRLFLRAGRESAALEALRAALEADSTGEVARATRELLREAGAPPAEELAARHALLLAALQRRARSLRCVRCGQEAPLRAWRCKRCGAFDPFGVA